jgi:AcrR family transcriptional regulator
MPTKPAKHPRRRAKQARSQQTVRAILEAAARVLEREGYARATTNRIAEAAGVSVGTVYEYFADKEALFDVLIERQIGELVAGIQRDPIQPDTPVATTIRRLLEVSLKSLRGGPGFIRALEQVPGALFRQRLESGRATVIEFVRLWLESHRDELRVSDLELAAFVAVSAAESVATNASDDLFGEALVDELTSMLGLYLTGHDASLAAT